MNGDARISELAPLGRKRTTDHLSLTGSNTEARRNSSSILDAWKPRVESELSGCGI
jgi:hypothetical protein